MLWYDMVGVKATGSLVSLREKLCGLICAVQSFCNRATRCGVGHDVWLCGGVVGWRERYARC